MELACRNATEEPSEANLVKLLDLWSTGWKHRGRTRAVGPGAYERYATLGLFRHGGVVGVSNATGRFPQGTWSSIAVLFNPRMGLHRDIQNMPGHSNHALALGDYTGGRVWIEDDEGDCTAWLADKKGGRELRGRWLDMHDKPVSFDARRYHMVEPHARSMWALAAYVPQAYARATEQHREALRQAGFPLPVTSLLYPCFKTALCYGVVSGCFVHGVSPSSRFRPELAPKRGLEGPELAFRTPENARKVHAKSSGP